MEKINFNKIHSIVIDFLNEYKNDDIEIIGSWYFRFLESDEEKLCLHLPYYTEEILSISFNYIRAFTFIYNLSNGQKLAQFEGTCLIDIFNNVTDSKMDTSTIDFVNQKENLVLWGENTLTKTNDFLPVFKKDDIVQYSKWGLDDKSALKQGTIENSFELFKVIKKTGIFDFPQLIELKKSILSFNNININLDELITENLFIVDNTLDDEAAEELEDKLLEQGVNNRILIKYPYSKKPHDYLVGIGKKKFSLIFNNRFSYNKEISKNDLVILNDETNLNTKLKYNVIKTNHSINLYNLFKLFNEQWSLLELNKYTTPFPKYWLLFVNESIKKEEWLDQFKKDFPAVAEKPIIKIVEQIINKIINLNWFNNVITDKTKILFPELKSHRKKRLEFVFNNFKNHIKSIDEKIEFLNYADLNELSNVIILDSFNVIDLVNKNQFSTADKIDIVVPDFLYFGYNPWIKMNLFTYQFSPLLEGMRQVLDENYQTNLDEYEKIKGEIKKEIIDDIKTYKNRFKKETEEEEEEKEEKLNPEDLELTNSEEIESNDIDTGRKNYHLIINENHENELTILSNKKVLVQKDTAFYISAKSLVVGDFILMDSDISKMYDYDKLLNVPDYVLTYQNQLFKIKDSYRKLRAMWIINRNPLLL